MKGNILSWRSDEPNHQGNLLFSGCGQDGGSILTCPHQQVHGSKLQILLYHLTTVQLSPPYRLDFYQDTRFFRSLILQVFGRCLICRLTGIDVRLMQLGNRRKTHRIARIAHQFSPWFRPTLSIEKIVCESSHSYWVKQKGEPKSNIRWRRWKLFQHHLSTLRAHQSVP